MPSVRIKTFGGRRFDVVGSAIWNSLPDYLTDPDMSFDTFRKYPKTYLFAHLSRFDYVTCAWFFTALMYSVISDRLAS